WQSFDVNQRRADRDEVPESDAGVRIVDHDALRVDAQEGCRGTGQTPADAEQRTHVLEVDDVASFEVGRRGAEGRDETENASRRAIEEPAQAETPGHDLVIARIGVGVGGGAGPGEVEDIEAPA